MRKKESMSQRGGCWRTKGGQGRLEEGGSKGCLLRARTGDEGGCRWQSGGETQAAGRRLQADSEQLGAGSGASWSRPCLCPAGPIPGTPIGAQTGGRKKKGWLAAATFSSSSTSRRPPYDDDDDPPLSSTKLVRMAPKPAKQATATSAKRARIHRGRQIPSSTGAGAAVRGKGAGKQAAAGARPKPNPLGGANEAALRSESRRACSGPAAGDGGQLIRASFPARQPSRASSRRACLPQSRSRSSRSSVHSLPRLEGFRGRGDGR